ncbi:MAG: hypothetical protein WCF23_10050, partial [Candidatus Nitrosopolaris sp.]
KDHETPDLSQSDDILERHMNLKMRAKEHQDAIMQSSHCNLVRFEAMLRLQRSKTHQQELTEYDDE